MSSKRACDHCGHWFEADDLKYQEDYDEYWCDSCLDNRDEAAAERQAERDMESPPESLNEQHRRAWEQKRKLR